MCGIVGYIGKKDAVSILIDGLKRLEYRGYDSAGIAVLQDGQIKLRRSAGKLANLEDTVKKNPLAGIVGIGHTRWATHGKPSEENAHPHTDCTGDLVVVHNGIIENYHLLKKQLLKEGHIFKSETDTEVVAHLLEKHYQGDLHKALRETLKELAGSYALGVISRKDPATIVAARNGSPLILGVGEGEYFIASDAPAILQHTRKVIYLDDGDSARLTVAGIIIYDKAGQEIKKKVNVITWDPIKTEKAGFKHFMLKEIFEQPQVILDTFRGRVMPEEGEIFLEEVQLEPDYVQNINKIFVVACGTSYHAGLVGKYLFEDYLRIPSEVDMASEFRYRNPIIDCQTLVIVISQSGETADTLAGLREAKTKGSKILSICNVVGSTITRAADGTIYTHAGPEIGVASTKAFTAQLTALYIILLYLGRRRGIMSKEEAQTIIEKMMHIPSQVEKILATAGEIIKIAQDFFKKTDFLYLGRNVNYPIALEGALKLKEISYIHAEGYPAGEMKHGPIALIDENMPVLAIATKCKTYEKILSNIEEVKARAGIVIILATEGDESIKKKADYVFFVPETLEILSPLLNVIPLQLLAYHIAERRGCDVDQPRNLAKSVTVE
ncbi:MAG: glutamine--fructose-6-phosphate transaminase (isomerizing) [Elusimicrobia bacterium]|nr:glutamine--fructose-6-phosphate transaminase (isomerizing) [Elusimicrobiota bacterium]